MAKAIDLKYNKFVYYTLMLIISLTKKNRMQKGSCYKVGVSESSHHFLSFSADLEPSAFPLNILLGTLGWPYR